MTDRTTPAQAALEAQRLDALLVAAPPNIAYLFGFHLRAVESEPEIAALCRAATAVDAVVDHVTSTAPPGMTEASAPIVLEPGR